MIASEKDIEVLIKAHNLLEKQTLAVKFMNAMGTPIERGLKALPDSWMNKIDALSQKAMNQAFQMAVGTMDIDGGDPIFTENKTPRKPSNFLHKSLVMTTGGAAGFFGLPALALELPVSTTLIMRSIADIARSEGEDLWTPEARVACLEVFYLGGGTDKRLVKDGKAKGVENGYYAVRTALSKAVSDAVRHLAEQGLSETGAPAIVRLISQVSSRFGIAVSEKAAAVAVPVLGAAGGVMVNRIFIEHFQKMAQGHFIIRRLERKYGYDTVKNAYMDL